MHEIDKTAFAEFLAKLRKEKGYTQRALAAKLFVSDKAVSKWERALSMPDIFLLMPLAEILDVSVTELLEGKRMSQKEEIDTAHVEALVKKALTFSEESPELEKKRQKKRRIIFSGCIVFAALEVMVGFRYTMPDKALSAFLALPLTLELLSLIFGLYFWVLLKERLPAYYDENKIQTYSDGFFRMSIPGLSFNNTNWPRILKAGRTVTAAAMVTIPVLWFSISSLPLSPDFRSGVRLGYAESGFRSEWKAHYRFLDGTMGKTIHPSEDRSSYLIEVNTEKGNLSIVLMEKDGDIVFSETDMDDGTYPVTLTEPVKATITADGHCGSFSIEPQ